MQCTIRFVHIVLHSASGSVALQRAREQRLVRIHSRFLIIASRPAWIVSLRYRRSSVPCPVIATSRPRESQQIVPRSAPCPVRWVGRSPSLVITPDVEPLGLLRARDRDVKDRPSVCPVPRKMGRSKPFPRDNPGRRTPRSTPCPMIASRRQTLAPVNRIGLPRAPRWVGRSPEAPGRRTPRSAPCPARWVGRSPSPVITPVTPRSGSGYRRTSTTLIKLSSVVR